MEKSFFIFLILAIVLQSCDTKNNKDSDTLEFNNYLNKNFNVSIPDKKHRFILIPSNQCKYCIRLDILENSDSVSIITDKVDDTINHNIYYDLKNNLQTLKLLDYQNTIVYTNGGSITNIIHVSIDSLYFFK